MTPPSGSTWERRIPKIGEARGLLRAGPDTVTAVRSANGLEPNEPGAGWPEGGGACTEPGRRQVADGDEHDPGQRQHSPGAEPGSPPLAFSQLGQAPGCHDGPAPTAGITPSRRPPRGHRGWVAAGALPRPRTRPIRNGPAREQTGPVRLPGNRMTPGGRKLATAAGLAGYPWIFAAQHGSDTRFAAPSGPGLWPSRRRQARWASRDSTVNGMPQARPAQRPAKGYGLMGHIGSGALPQRGRCRSTRWAAFD